MYDMNKQHEKGKLHAIERINFILDENSFYEIGSGVTHHSRGLGMENIYTPYDGVITGYGKIEGHKVCIYSQDFTVMGGTLGKEHGKKIANLIKLAIKSRCPIIGINDSGGARIQEGVHALAGYGDVFYYNTQASGYIPQISIIAGPCAGGAVYSPGITDFVFVVDEISMMFVTGPKVVKSVTNQNVSPSQLGGADMHANTSGVAHFRSKTEEECYREVRKLVSILPKYYGDPGSILSGNSNTEFVNDIEQVLPSKKNRSYDVRDLITRVLDYESFIEVQKEFARNIVVGFGRLEGRTVGIVANQPNYLAGVLDCNASDKAARLIRYCDAFDIPIITFTDVPGFMPGLEQETQGIIRHGAKLLYAYSEATTIKINIIIRKAYGGAYIAMCSKHLGADFVYAWPGAEIAVMGAEGAVEVLYNKEIKKMNNREDFIKEKTQEYEKEYLTPKIAVEAGYIDEIIQPHNTRKILSGSIEFLGNKKQGIEVLKKHGNIPM
jgi:acetyl-CoA carboxylase carboxyltransferase component